MSTTIEQLAAQMTRIELLLERLVTPINMEEGRQLAAASNEQRKAHNKAVLARAKEKQKGLRRTA